jgi:hypothetical protein
VTATPTPTSGAVIQFKYLQGMVNYPYERNITITFSPDHTYILDFQDTLPEEVVSRKLMIDSVVNGMPNSGLNAINFNKRLADSYALNGSGSFSLNTINFVFTGSAQTNTNDTIYLDVSSFVDTTPTGFATETANIYSANYYNPPYDVYLLEINSNNSGTDSLITFDYAGNNQIYGNTIPYSINGVPGTFSGGSNFNFGLVTSSFIAGVVVQPGYSYFDFTPNITIPIDTIQYRGTGEYTVTIT